MQSEKFDLRIDPDTKRVLKKLSQQDRKSQSAVVRDLIQREDKRRARRA